MKKNDKITIGTVESDLIPGKEIEFPEDHGYEWVDGKFVSYKYKKFTPKKALEPGNYKISYSRHDDIKLKPVEYKNKNLVELTGSKIVRKEIELFVNNFHLYEKRNLIPKRAMLFYSAPGQGKSATITSTLKDFIDKDTLVLNWICGNPREHSVFEWLSTEVDLSKNIKKLFFIIEEIGGTWTQNGIDTSSLLNLLDGNLNIFNVPTMILATTNHPENLLEAVSNRPGRFDVVREMPDLTGEDRVKLCKFYAFDMIPVDEEIVKSNKYNKLTIAHIEEAVNKSILENIPLETSLDFMLSFDKQYEKNFSKKPKLGLEN